LFGQCDQKASEENAETQTSKAAGQDPPSEEMQIRLNGSFRVRNRPHRLASCAGAVFYFDFGEMPLKYFNNSESVDNNRDASLFNDSL